MNVPPKLVSHKLKILSRVPANKIEPPSAPSPELPPPPVPQAPAPRPTPIHPVLSAPAPTPEPAVPPEANQDPHPESLPAVKTGPKAVQKPPLSSLAKGPESLPVLEAFQEFLESERRRAQNRMLALTFFFAFILFLFLGSAAFVGITLLTQMRTDYQDLENEVMAYRQNALRAESQLSLAATRVENETARIRSRMEEETRTLLAQARQEIETREERLDAKMEELKKLIHTLETEDDLAKTPPPPAPREIQKHTGIAMTIRLPDGKSTVAWRLPTLE